GIGNRDTVVIVPAGTGSTDFGSAARVYWTFKVLGHDHVTILNGGYTAWAAAGNKVAKGIAQPFPKDFTAHFRPQLRASTHDVSQDVGQDVQLVDARPAAYYKGKEKHPEARVAGTLRGALDLPNQLFGAQADNGAWLFDPQRVASAVEQSGLN